MRSKGLQDVKYPIWKLWVVHEGDLVVSGIDAVHGSVAVAGSDVDGLVMSNEMYAYRIKDPTVACAVYLQLLLRSSTAKELLEGMITGTSKRTRLESAEQLLELPIPPLPSMPKQIRIAGIYEESMESQRAAESQRRKAEASVEATWSSSDSFLADST